MTTRSDERAGGVLALYGFRGKWRPLWLREWVVGGQARQGRSHKRGLRVPHGLVAGCDGAVALEAWRALSALVGLPVHVCFQRPALVR